MRIFDHFNPIAKCPVCETTDDKPCALIGIDGTSDGKIEEARAVHLDCIDLRVNENWKGSVIIYQLPKNWEIKKKKEGEDEGVSEMV